MADVVHVDSDTCPSRTGDDNSRNKGPPCVSPPPRAAPMQSTTSAGEPTVLKVTTKRPGVLRILQATDLQLLDISKAYCQRPAVARVWKHKVGDTKACRERTLRLLEELISSQSIDVVMLTGDTIDGRLRDGIDDFEEDLATLADCFAKFKLPWAWLPGTSELQASAVSRTDLLNCARRLHGCVIPSTAKSFDYMLRLEAEDTNRYVDLLTFDIVELRHPLGLSRAAVESARSTAQRRTHEAANVPIARLAFIHRPVEAYDDAKLISGRQDPGRRRNEFINDGGLLRAPSSSSSSGFRIDAVFCGHHRHSDCVRQLRRDGGPPILCCYGRTGGFFPPSEHEGDRPLPFLRGARIIEVHMPETSACSSTPASCSAEVAACAAVAEPTTTCSVSQGSSALRTWTMHEGQSKADEIVELKLGVPMPDSPRIISQRHFY